MPVLPESDDHGTNSIHVQILPVHPVHKMQKLVLLGRQGGKQRIACIHAYLSLYHRKSIT